MDKYSLGIDLLSDPDKKLTKKYGAWGLKNNYGKEYEAVFVRSSGLAGRQDRRGVGPGQSEG